MLSSPMLLTVGLAFLGVGAFVAAVAVRTSGQCRHRVAHARVIAQARRIEEARRRQFLERLSVQDPPILPGLRPDNDGRH
jgi:ABC-type hemin transport system ATPase subunit